MGYRPFKDRFQQVDQVASEYIVLLHLYFLFIFSDESKLEILMHREMGQLMIGFTVVTIGVSIFVVFFMLAIQLKRKCWLKWQLRRNRRAAQRKR